MDFAFTFNTYLACEDYLKILYDGNEHSLGEFSKKYKTDSFSLDILLRECNVNYKGIEKSFDDLRSERKEFSEKLEFFDRYNNEIYYIKDRFISCGNNDYYKASIFLKKSEDCLQTGRYYLLRSSKLLYLDYDINWSTGYLPHFDRRCMHFKTSVVWYNSCFDYILLIIYFAFRLFEKMPDYKEDMSHEKLLKLCSYNNISKVYSSYKTNSSFEQLWKIISKCYCSLSEINEWANYIKHKGGISFIGLKADPPMIIEKSDCNGNVIAKTNEFDSIKIDLDESIPLLVKVHEALYTCMDELVDFIDFNDITDYTEGDNRSDYVKDIFTV